MVFNIVSSGCGSSCASGCDGSWLGVTENGANDMGVPVPLLKNDTSIGMPRKDEDR